MRQPRCCDWSAAILIATRKAPDAATRLLRRPSRGGTVHMGVKLQHGDDDLAENHEINVTPFIDVILVLLIIFMVAAPLATVDVAVNLPAASVDPKPRPEKPVFLTVRPDLTLVIGEETVDRGSLAGA